MFRMNQTELADLIHTETDTKGNIRYTVLYIRRELNNQMLDNVKDVRQHLLIKSFFDHFENKDEQEILKALQTTRDLLEQERRKQEK